MASPHPPDSRRARSRLESFRIANGMDLVQWPAQAGLSRTAFNRIRMHGDMNVETLARLVRAAGEILRRSVRAGEIADVGEDEPVSGTRRIADLRRKRYKVYDTPLDKLLVRFGVPLTLLANTARVTRPTLRKFRLAKGTRRVSSLAAIVRALRQLTGEPVRAADLCDVGETSDFRVG